MNALLSAAGRSFLRAFAGGLIVFAFGALWAPSYHDPLLLSLAALGASIAAGIRALQAYVPAITFARWLRAPYGAWADSFARAFLAYLCVTLPGALTAHDLGTARAVATSALAGAVTAGARAVEGLLTKGERPAPGTGIKEPPTSAAAAAMKHPGS